MEIKTFRAKTMPQALELVRRELGPEAMVLHTRERNASLLGRLFWGRSYEIAAAPVERAAVAPKKQELNSDSGGAVLFEHGTSQRTALPFIKRSRGPHADVGVDLAAHLFPIQGSPASDRPTSLQPPVSSLQPPVSSLQPQLAELESLLAQLRARGGHAALHGAPTALFDLFTDLIEADVDEKVARELIDRLRQEPRLDQGGPRDARRLLAQLLESEIKVTGPIDASGGSGRLVALVGPTGVGKTTTIAKLAANYRLRENRRVGLITVDTYRIAAVEQLRTYADIIDLPMEVVGTPREMREAVGRMRDFDLILMDTAGRSPRDEIRIRELRSMLAEAEPTEVHLVLSAAASARSLVAAAEKFAPVGVTAAIVTKLDEATGLGNLLSLARTRQLPFSYLTDGQNVPDDISVAAAKTVAQLILNLNP